jgi:hypothetical protein
MVSAITSPSAGALERVIHRLIDAIESCACLGQARFQGGPGFVPCPIQSGELRLRRFSFDLHPIQGRLDVGFTIGSESLRACLKLVDRSLPGFQLRFSRRSECRLLLSDLLASRIDIFLDAGLEHISTRQSRRSEKMREQFPVRKSDPRTAFPFRHHQGADILYPQLVRCPPTVMLASGSIVAT